MDKALKNLKYLIIDIQASNPKPEKGSILEIGWSVFDYYRSQTQSDSCSEIIQSKKGMKVPKHTLRITGLNEAMLTAGKPLVKVWGALKDQINVIQKANKDEFCPTIIHFARYEKPFLDYLVENFTELETSPFTVLCTHDLSKRFWPDLPRKGLRAVAGFLGCSVEASRRSHFHVDATTWIWRHCLEIFEKLELQTWAHINQWMALPIKKQSKSKTYPMPAEKRKNLPKEPGVYHMFRSNGDLLYVGKATSLKQRISSYFRKNSKHAEHILEMLSQATDLTVTQTQSALEAALLETDDIKNLSPPYNRALTLKERQLEYLSGTFLPVQKPFSEQKVRGPLPTIEPFLFISFLNQLMAKSTKIKIEDLSSFSIFGSKIENLPEHNVFEEGLSLFKNEYQHLMETPVSIQNLLRLGGRLRRLKMEAELEDQEETTEGIEAVIEDGDEWCWDSEAVCRRIKGIMRHSHKLMARSNWYARLANASIFWDQRRSKNKIGIALESGVIIKTFRILDSQNYNAPIAKQQSIQKIKCQLDIFDYDRLRVLTSEIKRLHKENRDPVIWLNAKQMIDNHRLELILPWV